MKKCPACKETKPYSEFPKNKDKKDGLGCHCRGCKKVYQARWYRRNSTRHKANTRKRAKEYYDSTQVFLSGIKARRGCVDCGEMNPVVLDFDHVRGKKVFVLARASIIQPSFPKLTKEILKCEIRCANCHRIVTHQRREIKKKLTSKGK